MMKKLMAMAIAVVLVLSIFPASFTAASYPTVKAGATTAKISQPVKFSIVTSNKVVKIQTLIDGKKGNTYTKYTEKSGLRYWTASLAFTKAGKRKVQYIAYTKSGSKVTIPNKPVYVNVSGKYTAAGTYSAKPPSKQAVTGEKTVFTVTTPSSVAYLRYYVNGKLSSKISKYASNSGGLKTWAVSMTFTTPGTRKIQFAAYTKKGSRLKKFPSSAMKYTVIDGAPKVNYFKMKDFSVVPVVEGNPKFYIDVYNQSNITVKIYDSNGSDIATLASGKKTTGQATYTWNVLDSKKQLKYAPGKYTAKMHAQNRGGVKDMSVEFTLATLETPVVKTDNAFAVDFDIVSLKGVLSDDGNVAISDAGFYYGTSASSLSKKASFGKTYEGDAFTKLLTGLSGNTTYYFQAYAVNIGGKKGVGEVLSFTTPAKTAWDVLDSYKASVDDEYRYLFNAPYKKYTISSPPVGYSGSSQASLHMQYVTVPVWKIVSGKYVASTEKIRVHRKLVAAVKQIFAEIYALPRKFPIKYISAFYYRTIKGPNASSTLSMHSYGCALDLNAPYNPHVRSGDPRSKTSPYTIPQEVVDIFIRHGWDWGGYFNSSKDYMHFEYLGTPLGQATPPAPPPEPTTPPAPPETSPAPEASTMPPS